MNKDFYTRPKGYIHNNTAKPHVKTNKRKSLRKALKKLAARKATFSDKSAGGHECHVPGSMKK